MLILEKNRKFNYKKVNYLANHPTCDVYNITFKAIDNSDIYCDMLIPKKIKGVVVEFPDYAIPNKDILNLSRYGVHNLAVVSLHIRGQAGKSNNNQPFSIYAPLMSENNLYYEYVYQDVLDCLSIVNREFSKIPIHIVGLGQGAALGLIAASFSQNIENLFIGNVKLCDFKTVYLENKDVGFYGALREYSRNIGNEEVMFNKLNNIDIINYAERVQAKVYYAYSGLNVDTPKISQNKLLDLIKNKEVIHYRKFENEVLMEHFFDEFILKKLSQILV